MLRYNVFHHGDFKKVLVANRGEIACRVFRTCREMNIRTVAVCCEGEPNAKHVLEADEAFVLGPPPASTSYLRGDRIICAAKKLQADAVHPGYGFLSENAEFASAVLAAGLKFVGPPPAAMLSMGSKSESKRIMEAAGVPIVPGYYGEDQNPDRLLHEAKTIGFPVLIKAVSGGGGKGMKIVMEETEFHLMLESAKREAINFFKDDRVILERYVMHPRHIECQIFFDSFGNGVFFFERDCSVQRRHQKVIEEAPAPGLSVDMRRRIGDVALTAARAVGYVGAGTVEFIFDTEKDEFFFMEMNTRLQVEHPVTEQVCQVRGRPLDLVRLQLQTAMGLPLGFRQEDISMSGASVEARIYAESPRNGFLPVGGRLRYLKEPPQGNRGTVKVRLDTGFRAGDDVLVHYDPMIAKLVVWGDNRATALEGLRTALASYHIVGVETNIDFLQCCLSNPGFVEGGVTTRFIEDNSVNLLQPREIPNNVLALAAVSYLCSQRGTSTLFWPNRQISQGVCFTVGGNPVVVRVTVSTKMCFTCDFDSSSVTVYVESTTNMPDSSTFIRVTVDGETRFGFTSFVTDSEVAVALPQGFYTLALQPLATDFGSTSAQANGSASVLSPMPGKVTKLLVADGTLVRQGQAILILEAMKMEHVVKASCDGEVKFCVHADGIVGGSTLLAHIASAAV
ncbi:3-methylcrotonyl-CoA carboxylase alpha subunit [Trypanosoma brucei equiperdum]|uniref:3-methylcrotonyl-CoA carboxylase alpha subunit n=1 Tax=Trypanosoma brucei equiperdum TaxID=630700 RepID=A0A3L6L9M1_9TRYP|nr:3-methylcrotonyl-CoA carboxylase alpha subunit [Trypanosoma brucei equiperdum]